MTQSTVHLFELKERDEPFGMLVDSRIAPELQVDNPHNDLVMVDLGHVVVSSGVEVESED